MPFARSRLPEQRRTPRTSGVRLLVETAIVTLAGVVMAGALVISGAAKGAPERAEVCGGDQPASASVHWVDNTEAKQVFGAAGVVFADARSEIEYQSGHITGSVHMPMDSGALTEAQIKKLAGAAVVIAYCDASDECGRSMRLATLLAAEGFGDVRVLKDGFSAWERSGFPAEAGTCRNCE
jgi:rhodanese-related sulfurtransferase